MSFVLQVFQRLPGAWSIVRTFSIGGSMEGKALFQRCAEEANRLNYREEGLWKQLQGHVQQVFQTYIYRYDNGRISVHFSDGRHFHDLHFSKGNEASGEHLCNRDLYKARYTFLNDNQFRLQYMVKGPEKDYTIQTDFTKLSERGNL